MFQCPAFPGHGYRWVHPGLRCFPMTNSRVPDTLGDMVREISAGGVVVRHTAEGWMMAAIEPQKEDSASRSRKRASQKVLLALPKGLVDPGEKPEQTAIREVHEETGVTGSVIRRLGDIKNTHVRSWGDKQGAFRLVSFCLLRKGGGRLDEVRAQRRRGD